MAALPYVSVHLGRFDSPVTVAPDGHGPNGGPAPPFLVGTDVAAGGAPPGVFAGRTWLGLGFHETEDAARGVVSAGPAGVPFLDGAAEVWAGACEPFSTRGTCNWLDRGAPGPVFAPADGGRHRGPFVVITTVGWIIDEHVDMRRVDDFSTGVDRVRAGIDGTDGLHSSQVFVFADPTVDALTVTFWRDDAAMRAFAYRPGEHKDQLDRFRELETADRTSFTRLRVLDSWGTWHGSDPLGW